MNYTLFPTILPWRRSSFEKENSREFKKNATVAHSATTEMIMVTFGNRAILYGIFLVLTELVILARPCKTSVFSKSLSIVVLLAN